MKLEKQNLRCTNISKPLFKIYCFRERGTKQTDTSMYLSITGTIGTALALANKVFETLFSNYDSTIIFNIK